MSHFHAVLPHCTATFHCHVVLLQGDAPVLAVYCTFSTTVPDALLEALSADLQDMMQVSVCVWGGVGGQEDS